VALLRPRAAVLGLFGPWLRRLRLRGLARISMTKPFRAAVAAALVAAAPLAVLAQAVQAPASASPPAPSASSPASAAQAAHKSAFDGYRRFDDQKVQPWREANDKVGRIGGWRAYARESAGDETKKP
jgi:hypothetical protein